MEIEKLKKCFPMYMESIRLPTCAKEQTICVYRACRTHKIKRASFLTTFEENGFSITPGGDPSNPQEYGLSTYTKPNDLKRFVSCTSKYNPPWILAKGVTAPSCGVSCRTRDWKKTKSSHVDWWLYKEAEPWLHFQEVNYEDERKNAISNR